MKLRLTVDPKFCGPVSVGTVDLIKILRDRLNLKLSEAKHYVDDAVYGGEVVDIPLTPELDGPGLVGDINSLETATMISVEIIT